MTSLNQSFDTELSKAFTDAGWAERRPKVRLRRMMEQAIRDGGGLSERVPSMFTAALDKADDIQLLWELFEPVSERVIKQFFEETLAEMRANGAWKNGDGGVKVRMPQGQVSKSPSSPSDTEAGACTAEPQGHLKCAPASVHRPQQPSLVRHGAVSQLAANEMMRKFLIDGRPLAEVTAGQARTWVRHEQEAVRKRAHECRWIDSLVRDLEDSLVVGRCRSDEDAWQVWLSTARHESDND